MNENKHLTLDERNFIEQELSKNTNFKEIAKYLGKDPTTISKEIRKHRIRKEGQSIHVNFNHCAKKFNCHRKNLCNLRCTKECRHCNHCNNVCSDFIDGTCFRLTRAPYVCNGCTEKYGCRLTKYYYRALPSFNKYKTLLSESRQGINMTELELSNLDKIVSPLVKKGQSLSHIYKTHDIPCTRATLYNYLSKNCFSVGPIDLPRKVRMKKRKQKKTEAKNTNARTNRTYEDFQKYIELHPELPIVEMDTVEGIKGGKVLLTLLFRNSRLMLAFILSEKTQAEVLGIFNMLEQKLGNELFEKTFSIILTDNGSEFGNPLSLEFNVEGIGRTRIFYCNPRASYQKGMIEKNHEFIRYVLPKGTSFDNLQQTDIDLMINHINSLGRASLNWSSPYDVAKVLMGKDVLKKLNLSKIPTDEIQLNKNLLKKN
ncbi:MAG: IS30 family transposase [Candidatus Gastranaerophilales bacterium]|nr:IS30 family transposase [Candidatus Gastranaerophilales bacterium]